LGLVSPSHVVPHIVSALCIAAERGFALPLIYNTSAYDSVDVLRLLDGIVDIYLPDLKYADEEMGRRYSGVSDYPRVARAAIEEMERQVGTDLVVDEHGLLRRGLIIRHLVLPNDIAGSKETLRWIRKKLGPRATLSVMAQYSPAHRARLIPLLDRTVRAGEYERVINLLERLGMEEGWRQEPESSSYYMPEFQNRDHPFRGGADNGE
jgi:putative pyruvate formate lyase activating enzyme